MTTSIPPPNCLPRCPLAIPSLPLADPQETNVRYLAQIQPTPNPAAPAASLLLLAKQTTAEQTWQVLEPKEQRSIATPLAAQQSPGCLVLVNVVDDDIVRELTDATEWVLGLVKDYLSLGLTGEFLHQEAARSEQWRQSLTLQNQELSRRTLEIEARREQLQDLQNALERDRTRLLAIAERLNVDLSDLTETSDPEPTEAELAQALASQSSN